MKNKMLKEIYDCFYTPPEFPAQKQEIEECHQALIEALEKPERRLVLQIIDAKELAQMLGHYRPTITQQNYEPHLPHKAQKDEDMPNEATQDELQQAANILDNLLKF